MTANNHLIWKAPRSATPTNRRPRLELIPVPCGACCGAGRLIDEALVICQTCKGRSWVLIAAPPMPSYDAGL